MDLYRSYVILLLSLFYRFLLTFGQQTSLQSCESRDPKTQCFLEFISEKFSQQAEQLHKIRNGMSRLEENAGTSPGTTPASSDNCSQLPRDCRDIQYQGHTDSGIYTIYPFLLNHSMTVYCDLYTEGGGWTVVQRRQDGSVNFNRTWNEYRNGFGDPGDELWIGNKYLHVITKYTAQELRTDLGDWNDHRVYAKYARFNVASEDQKFRLQIGAYSGSAGNSLSHSAHSMNGMFFSTVDRDNDEYGSIHCAKYYSSGFWFNACSMANINGVYKDSSQTSNRHGIIWYTWKGDSSSLKFTEMKVRPVA